MRYLFFLILICFCLTTEAQRRKDDGVELPFTGSIAYRLPQTGVTLNLRVKVDKFTPGPYADYAEEFLGIKGVKSSSYSSASIVELSTSLFPAVGETIYYAKGAAAGVVSLGSNGALLGVNTESTPSIEAHNSAFVGRSRNMPASLRRSILNSLSVEDTLSITGFRRKSDREVAFEIADAILRLRKSDIYTLSLEVDDFFPDGVAFRESFNRIDSISNYYISMFVGKTETSYYDYSFNTVPDRLGVAVCNFSLENGVVADGGQPLVIMLDGDEPAVDTASMIESESGLYYCIPGSGDLIVKLGSRVLSVGDIVAAQLGTVVPMPSSATDGSYSIKLHPTTGSIEQIKHIINQIE